MGISGKQTRAIVRERKIMHREIIRKHGFGRVSDAQEVLCETCDNRPCFLLPITTNGEVCHYYKPLIKGD